MSFPGNLRHDEIKPYSGTECIASYEYTVVMCVHDIPPILEENINSFEEVSLGKFLQIESCLIYMRLVFS